MRITQNRMVRLTCLCLGIATMVIASRVNGFTTRPAADDRLGETRGFSDQLPYNEAMLELLLRHKRADHDRLAKEIEEIEELLRLLRELRIDPAAGEPETGVVERIGPSATTVSHGVKLFHEISIEAFADGSIIPLGQGHHEVVEIPRNMIGSYYTPRHPYQGHVRFEVQRSQLIHVAMYGQDWGGGGNPSGGWQEEIVSPQWLEQHGWEQTTYLPVRHSNPEFQEEPPWIVYSKYCEAGEEYLLRNHKYQAPVLIWGSRDSARN